MYVDRYIYILIFYYKSRIIGNVMAGGMVKHSLVNRVGLIDCPGFAHKSSSILLEFIILW